MLIGEKSAWQGRLQWSQGTMLEADSEKKGTLKELKDL